MPKHLGNELEQHRAHTDCFLGWRYTSNINPKHYRVLFSFSIRIKGNVRGVVTYGVRDDVASGIATFIYNLSIRYP